MAVDLAATFAQPDNPVPLDEAMRAFLDAREREGVRLRSLVQLRSTLGQFIGFATLRLLPTELRPEIDRVRAEIGSVRAEIGSERAATLAEIVRRLDPALREAGRKAAEDADDVPGLLRRKLAPALRDAVAAARDAIESLRQPSDRDLAAAVVERRGREGARGV